MTQAHLRNVVFGAWLSFWALAVVLLCALPFLRNRGVTTPVVDTGEILPALRCVSGIWMPGVSCLAAFWFPKAERSRARNRQVNANRYRAALMVTFAYLLYVTINIFWTAYIIDYASPAVQLDTGTGFLERLSTTVEYCLLLSPVALAPINWLAQES